MPTNGSIIEPREFKRKAAFVNMIIVTAILCGFASVLFLIAAKWIIAFIWFIGFILWVLNYFWSKKTAFIRITGDEIALYPGMFHRLKTHKWDTIQNFNHISNKKIELILASNEKIKISLSNIDKKDQESFIQILESIVGGKDN